MKKVELLAPAGNYECLQAAVNAGADAVYLGGEKFGARAFAGNFTTEELIRGIHYAHLFGVRIFLTVNTLVKEKEFSELFEYINPLYEAGLDGVIIQDIGVFMFLKEHFPGLELHASTQMTITGVHGARLLKNLGAVRIVPARELSLQEVKEIHDHVDIEIECFIHGAMCYCYSGQCLFSSILGGRSGNRGRCAQPCRLPYETVSLANKDNKKKLEQYPLSLKDMCTIENISELIEAGITSFKIEGRMKSPEYVAGVTSIYRKVIDEYYKTGKSVKVKEDDLKILNKLYIRSERHNGYYFKHNGKNMITLSNPAYAGTDEAMIADIHDRFLTDIKRLPVSVYFYAQADEPMILSIDLAEKEINVSVSGATVLRAQNRPMEKADFEKQLKKTKDTYFEIRDIHMDLGDALFVPVKEINALRREAFDELLKELMQRDSMNRSGKAVYESVPENERMKTYDRTGLAVYASTIEQMEVVAAKDYVKRIYVDFEIADIVINGNSSTNGQELFLALPYVFRKRADAFFDKLKTYLSDSVFDGVLVRSLDELGWLREIGLEKQIQLDAGMYVWNKKTLRSFENMGYSMTAPYELNQHEFRELDITGLEVICYSHIPMMITANCIYKTYDQCHPACGNRDMILLKDRYDKKLPVVANCTNCYNVIYNSQIMSLHKQFGSLERMNASLYRIHLLDENKKETLSLLESFFELMNGNETEMDRFMSGKEYTNGHYKRGVE